MPDLAVLQVCLLLPGQEPLTVAVECGHVVGSGTCTRWEPPQGMAIEMGRPAPLRAITGRAIA